MMSQQYSLRWNNHQPNFISMFTTLLNTQTLVDVTLAAEGRHLQAHKVVLSACSTYFQSLFVDNPSRHPIVILKDVTFADLRTMVDFMYYGEVNVTEEQLPKVLDTAKLLKIKGLTEMPDSTSLTRSQTTSSDLQSQSDAPMDPPRHLASPSMSPSSRRKRFVRRKSSSSSTVHAANDDVKIDASAQTDLARGDSITLSSLPPQQRRSVDAAQQTTEQPHLAGIEPMPLDAATNPLQGQWMEHAYPRYTNSCLGGGLQEPAMYMGNVLNNLENNLSEFAQSMPVAGPSPGPSCGVEAQQPHDTPQVVKRRRTTNPQSEENFQRALEAVRFGGIGFCKAARMFGVNNRTLWLEYKKKGYPNNRPSIKNRIKREQPTPPPKQEMPLGDQQMSLLCPPPPVPVGFIDSRPLDFPLQGVSHGSPLNILGVNFNSMQ